MNMTSRQAKSMMLNIIDRLLVFPTTGYILFQKGNFTCRNQSQRIYSQLMNNRRNNSLVVVLSIARLTVWQQEHCTFVASRIYIRSVWHPLQINCAISIPAPNPGGRFGSETFHPQGN
jgi:hypothetical protein